MRTTPPPVVDGLSLASRGRTGDGRKRALAKGVNFGRKRKLSDYQRA